MAVDPNDAKYLLSYSGGATPDARRNTLIEGGPLRMGPAHFLVIAAPTRVRVIGGHTVVDLHYVEYILLQVFQWSPELRDRNMAWYLLPIRAARYFAHADAAGALLWQAFPTDELLVQHLIDASAHVPAAERMLDIADVHAYAVPANVVHLFDRVKSSQLITDELGVTAAVDYKTILSDAYIAPRRNAAASHFMSLVEIALEHAGDSLDSKSLNVQASALATFFKDSQPETRALRLYSPWNQQEAELLRRSKKSVSARFVPLLTATWTNGDDGGYTELKLAFPGACNGTEAVHHITTLLSRTRLPVAGGLTHDLCVALCDLLRGHALASANTALLRTAPNSQRGSALGDFLAQPARSTDSTGRREDAEKLHGSTIFKAIITALEAHNTPSPDYAVVITIMAKTAVGRCFLSGKSVTAPAFAPFAGARVPAEMTRSLDALLAMDRDGVALDRVVTPAPVAKLFITAKYDTANFKPWSMLVRNVIEIRDGKTAADNESQNDDKFWCDRSRLDLAEPIMTKAMEWIGHGGRHAQSYASFHNAMLNRARTINNLPDVLKRKPRMLAALVYIGQTAMTFAANRDLLMLAETIERTALPKLWFPPDSEAGKALVELDKDIKEALDRVRLHDKYGDGDAEDFQKETKGGKYTAAEWQQWHDQQQLKKQKLQHEQPWGSGGGKLTTYGVHMTSKGPIFGCRFLVIITAPGSSFPIDGRTCPCKFAHNTSPIARKGWCLQGCDDSSRPAGMSESDFRTIDVFSKTLSSEDKATADLVLASKASWQHMAGVKSKDMVLGERGGASSSHDTAITKGGGGGKGNGGKGKGGGGKGKGGKGKGGKAKGSPPFGRQR